MLLLAAVLMVAVVAWRLAAVLPTLNQRAVGDLVNIESYGFDLSNCQVRRERLAAAGMPKDGLPVLDEPATISPAEMDTRRLGHGPFLVPEERVIGVLVGGQARAYPIRIMTWHEIVNDVIGGEPVAVTYNPLCDSVAVFGRRVGPETLRFGASGLVYNSNLVLYDRRPAPQTESLWSQLLLRAISGPAAGTKLTPLPCAVLPWQQWREMHPGTDVLAPNPNRKKLYRREAYQTYFASGRLQFPAAPLPPGDPTTYKQPCIGLFDGQRWHVAVIPDLAGDSRETAALSLAGREIVLRLAQRPACAWPDGGAAESPPAVAYGFRFAWYAMYAEEGGVAWVSEPESAPAP